MEEYPLQNAQDSLVGVGTMPPKRKSETSATVRTHVLGEEVFTTDQVAHDLHISVRTVLRAIQDGKLKARRVGRQYLITRPAVRAYYEGLPEGEGENVTEAT
jgi:excisionase family DNA binding protein